MKVGTQQSLASAPHATREVEPKRTPVTRVDISNAIRRALEHANGERPPEQLVETLTAHASLETASGDKMFNFNFAGIKGHSPTGMTAVMKTHEVLGGREVVIRDGFRAYANIDEGARDYVRTMKAQFSGALGPAARGDVQSFASALKRAGYYTAAEADYARGLTTLMGAPSGSSSSSLSPARTFATSSTPALSAAVASRDFGLSSASLARVSDSLDAERWLGGPPSSFSSASSSSSASSRVLSASDDEDDS